MPQTLTDFSDAALLLRDLRRAAQLPQAAAPGSALMLLPTDLFTEHLPACALGGPAPVIAALHTPGGHVYATQGGHVTQVTHDGRHHHLSRPDPHAPPVPTDGYLLLLTPADLLAALPPEPSTPPGGAFLRALLTALRAPRPAPAGRPDLARTPVLPAAPVWTAGQCRLTPLSGPGAAQGAA